MKQDKQKDLKQVYVQYSKRITTACLIAFMITVAGVIALISWGGLGKVQIDALVQILEMVCLFETGVIASYATNSIFEKNFAAKYKSMRKAFDVSAADDEEDEDTTEDEDEDEVIEVDENG